jgi:hypothetical protein
MLCQTKEWQTVMWLVSVLSNEAIAVNVQAKKLSLSRHPSDKISQRLRPISFGRVCLPKVPL